MILFKCYQKSLPQIQHWFHSVMVVPQSAGYSIWSCILILLALLPCWCPESAKLEQGLDHNANISINYSFILHKDYEDSSINWVREHRHAGRWKRLSTPTSLLQNLGSVKDWSLMKSFRTLAEENRNWTFASRCATSRRVHDPTLQ